MRSSRQAMAHIHPLVVLSALLLWSVGVLAANRPAPATAPAAPIRQPTTTIADPRWEAESQFAALQQDIANRQQFQRSAAEVYCGDALIHETDRDPLDIVLRRTQALWSDLAKNTRSPVLDDARRQLDQVKSSAAATSADDVEARFKLFADVCAIRRRIALANPLLNFDKLLFVKRHKGNFGHMVDQYYGSCARPGGGLFVLEDPFSSSPRLREILKDSVVERGRLAQQKLQNGSFLSPDLSFDAQSIAFAYAECRGPAGHIFHTDPARGHWDQGRCYHIFKARIDGSGLEQLTDGTWNDFDPCFLPNGRFAFISERRGGYLRCGRYCPTYTLYHMAADGSDIGPLSVHETHEWSPSLTHDGRIIYTRWDYVDRDAMIAHLPWITTTDGRDARAVHGNFSPRPKRPDMELNVRAIPDSPKYVATAAAHHGYAFGSLVIIDPLGKDDDGMGPVRRLTPEAGFPESQVSYGAHAEIYGTAWPLSERYYLCAYTAPPIGKAPRTASPQAPHGLYLVDVFGNRELLYRDAQIGCISPMPLRPRPMPPTTPSPLPKLASDHLTRIKGTEQVTAVAGKPAEATMAVVNVYDGPSAWPAGTQIKSLRIIHIVPQSVPSQVTYAGQAPDIGVKFAGQFHSVVLARNVLGTVPVESDGSAHFTVPAHKEVYFQALDERGLAVQSMRSGTYAHPGETLMCNGCHDARHAAPRATAAVPLAMRRPPSHPLPEAEGSNPFSYPRLVQPVLDKYCVKCHQENAAKAPSLSRDPITRNNWFASYNNLVSKYGFVTYKDAHRTTPGQFGARGSKLLQVLDKGHHDLKLPPADLRRITLWLDCCSIFYGVYEKEGGAAQLRGESVRPTLE